MNPERRPKRQVILLCAFAVLCVLMAFGLQWWIDAVNFGQSNLNAGD